MRAVVLGTDAGLCGRIMELLAAEDFSVVVTEDPAQAAAEAAAVPAGLLVIDGLHPKEAGLALIRELRQGAGWTHTAVLKVLQGGDLADVVDYLDAGADDVLDKPFVDFLFLARVRMVLRRKAPGRPHMKILVIDDEEDYRVVLRDYLSSAGYEVRESSDGREGLARALESRPDLIVVDWTMPVMDGRAFVESLRGNGDLRATPVLMLTARRTAEDELDAIRCGVDDFLTKPLRAEELLARVRALLRRGAPAD